MTSSWSWDEVEDIAGQGHATLTMWQSNAAMQHLGSRRQLHEIPPKHPPRCTHLLMSPVASSQFAGPCAHVDDFAYLSHASQQITCPERCFAATVCRCFLQQGNDRPIPPPHILHMAFLPVAMLRIGPSRDPLRLQRKITHTMRVTQSTLAFVLVESAGLLSKSAVLALRTYASLVVGGVQGGAVRQRPQCCGTKHFPFFPCSREDASDCSQGKSHVQNVGETMIPISMIGTILC